MREGWPAPCGAEGNECGATLSSKGIDTASDDRLMPEQDGLPAFGFGLSYTVTDRSLLLFELDHSSARRNRS